MHYGRESSIEQKAGNLALKAQDYSGQTNTS
jgi:hypothetical protein